MKKILFLYQNAFSQTGGIQTFNKQLISALEDITQSKQALHTELASIYDNTEDIRSKLPFTSFHNSKLAAFTYIFRKAKRFDTFIFAHVNLAPVAALLYVLNPKAKIIFCTHGIEVWKKLPKLTEWIMNRSTVLTVSNFSMQELVQYNPALQDIRLFPNCIKTQETLGNFPNPYSDTAFNILSVTRLSETEKLKGVDTVIRAIPLVKNYIPNIKYTVIGKGDDVQRLQRIAMDLGVSESVDFLGFVDDINAYYQHCDLFTLPSKKEGFGIVYLEAMQYQKPVLAVNFGGAPDVVLNETTGYLCRYDDHECLAEKITLLSSHPELANRLGVQGEKHLRDNFTYAAFVDRLNAVLHDD